MHNKTLAHQYREQEVEDIVSETPALASFSPLLESILAQGVSPRTEKENRKARQYHYEKRCRYCGGRDHGSQRFRVYDDAADAE